MNFLRQSFRKLSSDRQTDRQTDRETRPKLYTTLLCGLSTGTEHYCYTNLSHCSKIIFSHHIALRGMPLILTAEAHYKCS